MTDTDIFVRASESARKFVLDLSNQLNKGWNAERIYALSKGEVAALIRSYVKERDEVRQVAAALNGGKAPDPTGLAKEKRPPVDLGFYIKDGNVYQVVSNQAKTHRYAKILVNGKFEYAPGAIYLLANEDYLTASQAKAYYEETGNCIFCHREITRESSKSVGYGPRCAEKYGLPHPDNA